MDSEYLNYRLIDLFSRSFPRRLAYRVGDIVSYTMFAGDAKSRNAVISNLRRILRYKGLQPSETELERLARDTFRNFAKYLVDFFKLRKLPREAVYEIVTVENEQFLEQAAALGRGVIALSAHLSSWEVGGSALVARGYSVIGVYHPLKSPRAAELFRKRREERNLRGVPFGNAVGPIIDSIRKKEWIAIAGDIDFSLRDDLVDFCGAPARVPIGPAKLCVKFKTPILPCFVVRRPDDTFIFRLHPPIIPNETTTVEEVRKRICSIIENEIMDNPTHWFVFIDFWDIEASRRFAIKGE